jgi:histidinol phosphatase-like PHP family hydrolase
MMDMHNHTIWSYDAHHEPEKIIENAIYNGIKVLGISDHHRSVLMGYKDLNKASRYISAIRKLKDYYKKQISIQVGFELNVNFYPNEIKDFPYDLLEEFDYVLLEHVDATGLFADLQRDCITLENIGFLMKKLKNCKLVGLAHTDLLQLAEKYGGIDRVVEMLANHNLFWEINTRRDYEYFDFIRNNLENPEVIDLFQKLREYDVKVTAATDTHYIPDDFDSERLEIANDIAYGINPLFRGVPL